MAEVKTNVELQFLNVVAGTSVPVDISVFDDDQVYVYLTSDRVAAVQGTDYTVSQLAGSDTFRDGFRLNIMASMITKIMATGKPNLIYVRRQTELTSEFSETDAFLRDRIVDEADKNIMRLQEMGADVKSAVRTPLGEAQMILPPIAERAGKVLQFDADGKPALLAGYEQIIDDAAQVAIDRAAVAADRAAVATDRTAADAAAVAASGSATSAAGSASTASNERALAQAARSGADTAASNAAGSATAAQTAKTAAETAQGGAQTARTGAETARDAANGANAAAQGANTAAQGAKVDVSKLYQGALTADPAADLVGNPLTNKAYYYNPNTQIMRIFDTAWKDGPDFKARVFDVKKYGATGGGSANDAAAIQAAVNAAIANGGGTVFFPKGVYRTFNTIAITNTSNVTFLGEGPNTSIIELAAADQWMFYDSGTTWWRTWSGLGFRASVTMNKGMYFFNLVNDKRGLFENCNFRGYAHGIWFQGFEETKLRDVRMSAPSNDGIAVIAGSLANTSTGANLYIESCFFRGFDDITQDLGTLKGGSIGLEVRDCNAVFAVNSDWSAYGAHDVKIVPQWGAADHHFAQCFFDTTANSHCFYVDGAGLKQKISFTGSWFAGAGNFGANGDKAGFCTGGGDYRDFVFTGCRFYSNKGTGLFWGCQSGDVQITGCHFNRNGYGAPNFVGGIYVAPPGIDVYGPSIIGNRFMQNNVGGDVVSNGNARGILFDGNYCQNAVSLSGANHIIGTNRTP